MPLIQGFEDAGDFTVTERLKTSVHVNLVFYLILGAIGLIGLVLLIMMHKHWFVSGLTKMIYIVVDISFFLCLPSSCIEILILVVKFFFFFLSSLHLLLVCNKD